MQDYRQAKQQAARNNSTGNNHSYSSRQQQQQPTATSAVDTHLLLPSESLPSWLVQDHPHQQQRQQGTVVTSSSNSNTGGGLTYTGLCGTPDTRRTFYKSTRQQQREQRHQHQHHTSTARRPQHSMMTTLQSMPSSEPIYMDIDPSILAKTPTQQQQQQQQQHPYNAATDNNNISSRRQSSAPPATTTRTSSSITKSPLRLKNFQCLPSKQPDSPTTLQSSHYSSTPNSKSRTLSATTTPSPTMATTPLGRPSSHSSSTTSNSYSNPHQSTPSISNVNSMKSTHSGSTNSSGSKKSPRSPSNIPFVNPYVSPIARDYHVPGGPFQNYHSQQPPQQQPQHPQPPSYRYTDTGLQDNHYSNHNNNNNHGLIMFGDDYDLGSITTGMSQQELLQKRRDVKKRREEKKYGNNNSHQNDSSTTSKKKTKSKKHKERIINMPAKLLSGAWDTSPIHHQNDTTNVNHKNQSPYLSTKDNSERVQYNTNENPNNNAPPQASRSWKIMRTFSPPDEETGTTDASTRESGEDGGHQPQQQHQQQQALSTSDNISLSSFPLLSTNAKEGLTSDDYDNNGATMSSSSRGGPQYPTEAPVHFTQPGDIPQLQVGHYNHYQQQGHPQEHGQWTPRPQHMDIYQRQHGEELKQLEYHLKYLQDQHSVLENEIQERQRQQGREGVTLIDDFEYDDNRPRSVRFAAMIAQSMEDDHRPSSNRYQAPYDESGLADSKDSPTSVAQFDYYNANQDNNNNSYMNNSAITPKNLFQNGGKPKSILRKKGSAVLDETGRYPGAHNRGRTVGLVPLFMDSNGREVSPIRSPGRPQIQQQPFYQMATQPTGEDLVSIPDNPDDKDIAVLFDPDADADIGIEQMRREFDDDSGMISDAFIEAVAAIVLQTAIRRFLAIRKTQALQMRRNPVGLRQNQSDSVQHASMQQQKPPSPPRNEIEKEPLSISRISDVSSRREQIDQGDPMAQEDFFYDLAAIQIQSVFRGWWVRDSINVDHYCASLIQKTFRGYRAQMEYDYDLYRIILIQSIWRRKLAIHAMRRIREQHTQYANEYGNQPQGFSKTFEKAKMQQKLHKKLKAKPVERELPTPSNIDEARIWQVGAIIIQTYWRSYVSRICFLQSISDIVVIQAVARGWLTRRWLGISSTASVGSNNSRGAKPPKSSVIRGGARFSKFESFESKSSLGSSNRKMNSMDESVPSVPFRILPDEDPDQPPSLTPPTKTADEQRGHFDDPNRFGGARNVWDRSATLAHGSSRDKNGNHQGVNAGFKNQKQHQEQTKWNHKDAVGSNSGRATVDRQSPSNVQTQGKPKEIPRSKGWNADEEIDKQGTRNLLMAWKQKDKANTFTIRPRSGS